MRPAFQIISVLIVGLGLMPSTGLLGQAIPSSYTYIETRQETGVFVGYMNASTGRFGYGPSGGIMYGGRYGLQLGGPMSLEAVASVTQGSRDVINPARVEGDRVIGEGDVLLTGFEARLKFSATGDRAWHGLSPFLVFGGGIVFDLADPAAADAVLESRDVFEFGTSFLGTLALGTRWFVSDRFAVRPEGTFSLWKLSTPPGFGERNFESVDESEWVRGLSLTVSLLYRW